ncbi:MAG: hypothetical protein EXQ69_08020 [Acidimicrobiia bacterium]|nr:hypothetical protein [Acidimicrobiia bacterium]
MAHEPLASQAVPVSKSKRSRYTPPPEKKRPQSHPWIPTLMFALFACGTVVVISNYLGLLPGTQQNSYLLLGLGEITAGFMVATMYR